MSSDNLQVKEGEEELLPLMFKTQELFPTQLLLVKDNTLVDLDVDLMCKNIDDTITDYPHMLDQNNPILWQCKYNVWDKNSPEWPGMHNPDWQRLRGSFLQACQAYISKFFPETDRTPLHGTKAIAWWYKSSKEEWKENIHNHLPAFLSGVYYLKMNGSDGTVFFDPRTSMSSMSQGYAQKMHSEEGVWLIFPSWLKHSGTQPVFDDDRYTIAADLYVARN